MQNRLLAALAVLTVIGLSSPVLAQSNGNGNGNGRGNGHGPVVSVPEIDAGAGLAALAAVCAALVLAWERRRKHSA